MSVRQRAIVGGAATLAVSGATFGLFFAQGPGDPPNQVEVIDTVGVLYQPDIDAAAAEIDFYAPTDVVVISLNVPEGQRSNDDAFNFAVLDYARSERPEWITPDGQKWADDLYIYGFDPDGRFVGTYLGDNRAIGSSGEAAIQENTYDELRAGRWTQAAIAGMEEGAARIERPFIRSGLGMAIGFGASAVTLALAVGYIATGVARRSRSREARAAGDASFANVVRDYEETEVHANLIPADSDFGGRMLRKYDEYTAGFARLTDLGNRARAIPESHYDSNQTLQVMTDYRDEAVSLDHLDDVIADTAALLNLDRGWETAWSRQMSPLRDDLNRAERMLGSPVAAKVAGTPQAQTLREFATSALAEIDRYRGDLETRSIRPDDALTGLQRLQDELSGHLEVLSVTIARAEYSKMAEQDMMRREMSRRRGHRGRPTILTTTNPTWTWVSVASLQSGHREGHQSVERSRAASSSSSGGGSSSSYSSSGGSFSGSGSSSRF